MVHLTKLAKLTRPRTEGLLKRDRLFGRLDDQLFRKAVWVAGPPGAGKTSFVASYLNARKLRGIWYQIDSGDSDPATFFYYLGLAVGTLAPAKHKPLALLTPEYLLDVPGFARRYFRTLFDRLPARATVVLDNYEQAPTNSNFADLIHEAFEQIPDHVALIVISRTGPPARLARVAASERLAYIEWEDLRLTLEETRRLAASRHPVDESALALLHRRSDGWAAGLTLMLERLKRTGATPENIEAETREAVFDYFAGEIFERAPAQHQHLLISTAFLPRATADMAETLTGNPHAGKLLDSLYRHHLFIDRRIGNATIYQFHSLFREFLLSRAKEIYTPLGLAQLANRAGQLLESNGHIEDAVTLYFEARDWAASTRLILEQAPRLLSLGRGQTLREWIGRIPLEYEAHTPWLSYWLGTSLIPIAQSEARKILERAYAEFESGKNHVGQILAAAGIVETYYFEWSTLVPLDKWISSLDALLAANPQFPSLDAELRAYSGILLAIVYRQPSHALLPAYVERVATLLDSDLNPDQCVIAGTTLVAYCGHAGQFELAHRVIDKIDALLKYPGVTPLNQAAWRARRGFYFMAVSEYRPAEESFHEAEEIALSHGLDQTHMIRLYLYQALQATFRGDLESAALCVARLQSAAKPTRRFDLMSLDWARAMLAARKGDPIAVQYATAAVTATVDAAIPTFEAVFRIPLVGLLVERGEYDVAVEHIQQERRLIHGTFLEHFECELFLLEALLALRKGDRSQCHVLLKKGLGLAKSTYLFPIRWLPSLMSQLCAEALRAEIEVEFVRSAIKRYSLAPPSRQAEDWPWPIRIYTLGSFEIHKDGVPVRFGKKPQRMPVDLLKAIIAIGRSDVHSSEIAAALWPDAEGDAAQQALSTTLHRLRKLLGSEASVERSDYRIRINPRFCWVDAWALESLADPDPGDHGGHATTGSVDAQVRDARRLYRGNFLQSDGDKHWIISARKRLLGKFSRHLVRLGRSLEDRHEWREAAELYSRGIECDDLGEEFYRRLMVCLRESGQYAEALKVYRRCREMLSISLGAVPTAETNAVYRTLSGHSPG